MVGTQENPVEIDEARFAGRRKYNRGRQLTVKQMLKTTETTGEE